MKLLILGGTLFLGRHLTEAALTAGHEVTLFNRGQRNPDLFPAVEKLRGDRDGDLSALAGRRWDAVIDTSGYIPRLVGASATMLADAVDHYTFVSSVSVYADFSKGDINETAPVGTLEDETVEEITNETYGPLKALSEAAAEAAMPGRVLVVRPGLIVGPHDPTDRFTYWVRRAALAGEMLAPERPSVPVQIIDARDLAEWMLTMIAARETGVYNATGPDQPLSLGDILAESRLVSHSEATVTWVDETFLLENEVQPWSELPLWVPDTEEFHGFMRIDVSKALAAGLSFRPLAETVGDTLTWDATRPDDYEYRAGLSPTRERDLLAAWHHRSNQEAARAPD